MSNKWGLFVQINQCIAKWVADVHKFDHNSPVSKKGLTLQACSPPPPSLFLLNQIIHHWLLWYTISTSADISHSVGEDHP